MPEVRKPEIRKDVQLTVRTLRSCSKPSGQSSQFGYQNARVGYRFGQAMGSRTQPAGHFETRARVEKVVGIAAEAARSHGVPRCDLA